MARLESFYRNEPRPRWKRDLEYFKPSTAGRRTCRLSPTATEFLITNLRGRNSREPAFILIEPEGDVRLAGVQIFSEWAQAVRLALDDGLYVYNARTKRCSRPVWSPAIEERTIANMTFEAVKLLPDQRVYDEKLPRVTSRLFAQEEE